MARQFVGKTPHKNKADVMENINTKSLVTFTNDVKFDEGPLKRQK